MLFVRNIDEEKVAKNCLAFHAIDTAHAGQIDQDAMKMAI